MATNLARYRTIYAWLLRLYPDAYYRRFGEGMAQTFQDLMREHGSLRFALWLFGETLVGIVRENTIRMSDMKKTVTRAALVALGLLMVPVVASQVVEGWNWPVGTFVFTYVLFFGTVLAFLLIAGKMGAWSYKAAVGLALVAGFTFGWSNMVHVSESDNPANLTYFSVLAVGVVGAWLARLEAQGLALTLFAMAATLGLIAALLPSGEPPALARSLVIARGVYVMVFTSAGLLFRNARAAASRGASRGASRVG
jgi:hypothetical protein